MISLFPTQRFLCKIHIRHSLWKNKNGKSKTYTCLYNNSEKNSTNNGSCAGQTIEKIYVWRKQSKRIEWDKVSIDIFFFLLNRKSLKNRNASPVLRRRPYKGQKLYNSLFFPLLPPLLSNLKKWWHTLVNSSCKPSFAKKTNKLFLNKQRLLKNTIYIIHLSN